MSYAVKQNIWKIMLRNDLGYIVKPTFRVMGQILLYLANITITSSTVGLQSYCSWEIQGNNEIQDMTVTQH